MSTISSGASWLCEKPPVRGAAKLVATDSASPVAPYRIVNIGGGHPVSLMRFVEAIEPALGRKAERNYMDMQPGDVLRTEASTELLEALIGFRPATPIETGVEAFVRWYRDYYRV